MNGHVNDHRADALLVLGYIEEAKATRERERTQKEKIDQENYYYVLLNNLYLQMQRKETRLTISSRQMLYDYLAKAYDEKEHMMREFWEKEFQRLPNWNTI
jgi:hypothetical protein